MDLKKLLSQMTLRQKIAQLQQIECSMLTDSTDASPTGPIQTLGFSKEDLACVGSVLNCFDAETMIEVQKKHLEDDPNHIPLLFMLDVIHGYRTIYPIPLAMGCSFDLALAEDCARMAAHEASVSGNQVTFAPMVDLARDARWGRVMETTGEDKTLNSRMAEAFVKGYQGDLSDPSQVAACVKHFAAYGAAEAGRDYNTTDLSEHSLREQYLPAYRAAIDAGARMLMTSFNSLNGLPSTGNRWLLHDILRKEWGFDGMIISDYNAYLELISHGVAEDEKEAAALALNATCDMEMVSATVLHSYEELIREGSISEAQIDKAVLRVLQLKDELGLFDDPFRGASPERAKSLILCDEHRALARRAAEESAVLLKNENNTLPFAKTLSSLAVIGPFANEEEIIGFWSCQGQSSDTKTVLAGIREAAPNLKVTTAKGCGKLLSDTDTSGIDEAVRLAKEAEAVVLCLGEDQYLSGESASRATLCLPVVQLMLAREVLAANPNTAVILFNGRPLDISELSELAPAILDIWQPGTEGGAAAAALIFGDKNPSGKLSMTFPRTIGQEPIYYNHLNTGRPNVNDDPTIQFFTRYIDCRVTPLYPFGHGLSYTSFAYGEPLLDKTALCADETLTLTVSVTNAGDRGGYETVQVYLRDPVASLTRPVLELKDFTKIWLEAGETKSLSFTVNADTLAFYTASGEYKAEKGRFELYVGGSSEGLKKVEFTYKA